MVPKHLSGGWIEVVTGCMFSGKTDELIRRLERAELAGHEAKVFKPRIDNRYGEEVIGSHNGRKWRAEIVENNGDGVEKIVEESLDVDVIGIDEGNFFPSKLIDVVERLADNGQRVIVSGLDTNYRGDPFEPMHHIIARAEYVDKLRAICHSCGEPATRTQRIIDGESAHEDDPTIVVGADEKYEARCRSCHSVRRD